jgi:hypothetical protein
MPASALRISQSEEILMLHVSLAAMLLGALPLNGPAEKLPGQNAMRPGARTFYLADKLTETVNFDGFDDPKMTLQDALDYLTDRYDLSFDVDDKAFAEAIGKKNPRSVLTDQICGSTPIPKMRAVSLETVIRKILVRLDVASGATFLLHRDQILITTQAAASLEVLGDCTRILPPLVHRRMEKRLLRDALDEVAELTDVNVVLDESVGEKAKEVVTARFLNTPVETAVRVLANKANLSMVRLDNLLYVTTFDKAEDLREEIKRDEARRARERMPLADEQPKTNPK